MLEALKNPFILWAMALTITIAVDAYVDSYVAMQVSRMSSLDEVIKKLQLSGNLCPEIKTDL